MHKKIAISNKFEALEGHEEENQNKLVKENLGSLLPEGNLKSLPMVEVEIGDDTGWEGHGHGSGEEAEDMDIADLDLEGIEKYCTDKWKGYVPQEQVILLKEAILKA